MQYLAPMNAFEFAWELVSKEDRQAIIELLKGKGFAVGEDFKPEKVWISGGDSSYYILIIEGVAAPNTVNITLQSITAKQLELGII